MTVRRIIATGALLGLAALTQESSLRAGKPAGIKDWPMWGGSPDRNMVSDATGLPSTWDVKTKANVKWVANLGSQTYGNATVGAGMVFVGTNNEASLDPKQAGDRGVLMAFKEDTGEFMWQITHEKLSSGRVNDWPFQGIASSPLVEGDKVYYVSNRAELMCVDAQGFRDKENDGPVTDEKFTGEKDGDIIWKFDMMEEVGTFPHNLANSSPVVRRSHLRHDLQRSGREPRQHPVAEGAGDHRGCGSCRRPNCLPASLPVFLLTAMIAGARGEWDVHVALVLAVRGADEDRNRRNDAGEELARLCGKRADLPAIMSKLPDDIGVAAHR